MNPMVGIVLILVDFLSCLHVPRPRDMAIVMLNVLDGVPADGIQFSLLKPTTSAGGGCSTKQDRRITARNRRSH